MTDEPGVRAKKLADPRERIVISALELFGDMHNFASTWEQLWRVHSWGSGLALTRAVESSR